MRHGGTDGLDHATFGGTSGSSEVVGVCWADDMDAIGGGMLLGNAILGVGRYAAACAAAAPAAMVASDASISSTLSHFVVDAIVVTSA